MCTALEIEHYYQSYVPIISEQLRLQHTCIAFIILYDMFKTR